MLRAFAAMLTFAVVTGLSPAANAGVVFSDDFNSYPTQLNWVPPANWTSGPGTTDLIGNTTSGPFFDLYPGNGGYVDLEGSTTTPGTLSTNLIFAPGTYTLSFFLGGNARGDVAKTTTITLGNFFVQLTLVSTDPLALFSYTFTTTGGQLIFADLPNGGNQNIGNVLDNVTVEAPEPSTTAMIGALLLALFGFGAVRRRRA